MTNCVSSSATKTVRLRVRLLLLLFVTSNAAVYPKTARTPRERQQHLRPQQEQQRFQRESTRITPDKQEKSCNACIEAAEAWRENFVCGASMALDVDWTPSGIIESNTCPEVLRCKGFYVDDDLVVCENLKKSMMDQEVYETIYEALSEFKPTSKYEDNQARIAEEIKEGGDPEIYANNNRFMYWKAAVKVRDKTMCDDTAKPCREALLGPLCRDDPSCDLARTVRSPCVCVCVCVCSNQQFNH